MKQLETKIYNNHSKTRTKKSKNKQMNKQRSLDSALNVSNEHPSRSFQPLSLHRPLQHSSTTMVGRSNRKEQKLIIKKQHKHKNSYTMLYPLRHHETPRDTTNKKLTASYSILQPLLQRPLYRLSYFQIFQSPVRSWRPVLRHLLSAGETCALCRLDRDVFASKRKH